jgi:hypothetical protein
MKNFMFFVLLLFGMSSCMVLPKYSTYTESVDLLKYNSQGFLVTTGDLDIHYVPLQFVVSEAYSGYVPKSAVAKKVQKSIDDDIYTNNRDIKSEESSGCYYGQISNYDYKFCSLDDIFTEIISQSKKAGANGLINIKITEVSKLIKKQPSIGYQISGLAIKIE